MLKMKDGIRLAVCSVAASFWFSGICAADEPKFDLTLKEPIKIRVGHVAQPKQTTHLAMERMKKLVEDKTNKQVQITIFPAGILSNGDGIVAIDQTIAGAIQMTPTITPYASRMEPRLSLVSLPFLFAGPDQVGEFIKTRKDILNEMGKWLEPKGLVVTNWWPRGFRQFWSVKQVIRTPDDIKGVRIRVINDPIFVKTAEVLGAKPVPMAWGEVYTALQTRAIDAVEPPLSDGLESSLAEVAKFVSVSNYTTDLQPITWNKSFWDRLPQQVRDVLVWAGDEAGVYKGELEVKNDKAARDRMVASGSQVVELNRDELQQFRTKLAPLFDSYSEKYGEFARKLLDATK